MAQDPTKNNRAAIANAIVPSGSPLGQSLSEQRKREADQLAADEANNYVMQRQAPVLPVDAQNLINPQSAAISSPAAAETAFINPGAPQVEAQRLPAQADPSLMERAPSSGGYGIPDQSSQIDKTVANFESKFQASNDEIARLQQEKAAAIQTKIDEDDKNVDKIEPHGFFHGKSTWQKVLGGVGLFLGSITPEGSRNVASIIDKEIERDIDSQKTNIKLKLDKKDKNFARLLERYGSQEAALLAKKKDAYSMLDLHLKKLQMNAKNDETRARLGMGREELNLKKQSLTNDLVNAMYKQNKEDSKGTVPGYQGTIQDPTSARDFRKQVSSAQSAYNEIDNLLKINTEAGSSLSPSSRASAGQSQALLLGQLREILVGPGSMSEGDRTLMEDAIANPTNFFSLKSSNKIKLDKLKKSIQSKIEANANAYGLNKQLPQGARKV